MLIPIPHNDRDISIRIKGKKINLEVVNSSFMHSKYYDT